MLLNVLSLHICSPCSSISHTRCLSKQMMIIKLPSFIVSLTLFSSSHYSFLFPVAQLALVVQTMSLRLAFSISLILAEPGCAVQAALISQLWVLLVSLQVESSICKQVTPLSEKEVKLTVRYGQWLDVVGVAQ